MKEKKKMLKNGSIEDWHEERERERDMYGGCDCGTQRYLKLQREQVLFKLWLRQQLQEEDGEEVSCDVDGKERPEKDI